MPTISVIVPIYNTEKYLPRCIDSILAQTFTDFELILVDDGSTDSSGAICDEYAEKDSRIRVFHQSNQGQAAARNHALDWMFANSESKYISFVDSDDWVHEQYLEWLYGAINQNDDKISVCKYCIVDDNTELPAVETRLITEYSFDSLICSDKRFIGLYQPVGKLYSKDSFCHTRFPAGRICEDLFILPELLFRAKQIAVIDATLYYYYQSANSTMRKQWSIQRLDEIEASESLLSFVRHNCSSNATKRVTRRHVWVLCRQIGEYDKSNYQDDKGKSREFLLNKLRMVLLRNMDIYPIRDNIPLYKMAFPMAFPILDWLYWTFIGIMNKLRRIFK